jgi:hypothetical protein
MGNNKYFLAYTENRDRTVSPLSAMRQLDAIVTDVAQLDTVSVFVIY